MSFVKDDHRYTRGVGAIASMDAASPNRRIAAAREARALARRDAIMALGATRAAVVPPITTRTSTSTKTSTSTIETGQESAFSRPPPAPVLKKLSDQAMRARALLATSGARVTKLPGSIIGPIVKTSTEPPPPPKTVTPIAPATTAVTTKPSVTIVAGGASAWPTGGKAAPTPPPDMPPPEPIPDMPDMPVATSAPQPKASKTPNRLLMYAAIGIGAWWLLTRE